MRHRHSLFCSSPRPLLTYLPLFERSLRKIPLDNAEYPLDFESEYYSFFSASFIQRWIQKKAYMNCLLFKINP